MARLYRNANPDRNGAQRRPKTLPIEALSMNQGKAARIAFDECRILSAIEERLFQVTIRSGTMGATRTLS